MGDPHMARTIPRPSTTVKANKPHPLLLPPTWEMMPTLKKQGFVQMSECPLPPTGKPFVVQVSVPVSVPEGVPFYLHIVDQEERFELVISDDDVVTEFLSDMPFGRHTHQRMYCWAEVDENGEIDFDTKTPCPAFQ